MAKKKRHHSGGANMALGESGPAHLPTEAVMRQYPKMDFDDWNSDFDSPEGVDRQMNEDTRGARRQNKHKKY